MIIKKLDIESFGKFSGSSFSFEPGFNLIFGSNGDGKSTLMSFMRLMLYGNSGKSTDISKNLRKKYFPWNGTSMSGAMEIETEGSSFRLHKNFKNSALGDSTALFNLSRGEEVPLSPKTEVGQILLGMSLGEFERSIFIEGFGGFPSDASGDSLAMRIANLSETGDEKLSRERAAERILDAMHHLVSKSGKKGLLVESRERLQALEHALELFDARTRQQHSLTSRSDLLRGEISQLEAQLDSITCSERASAAKKELSLLLAYKEKLQLRNQLSEKLENYKLSAESLRTLVEKALLIEEKIQTTTLIPFQSIRDIAALLHAESKTSDTDRALTELRKELKKIKTKVNILSASLTAAALIPSSIPALLMPQQFYWSLLLWGLCVAFGLVLHRFLTKNIIKNDELNKKALCLKKALSEQQLVSLVSQAQTVGTVREARLVCSKIQRTLSQLDSADRGISTLAPLAEHSVSTLAQLDEKIQSLTAFLLTASESPDIKNQNAESIKNILLSKRTELHDILGRISLPEGDRSLLSQQIFEERLNLERLEKRYGALSLAAQAMDEAASEMNNGLGMRLRKNLGEYLEKMSGGSMKDVLVSRSFDIDLRRSLHEGYRHWKYQSSGTVDMLYLALRLVATDIIAEEHGPLPLFLDDILAQYDSENCKNTLAFLKDYCETSGSVSQIFFFTCHEHIADMAKDIIPNINKITL